MHDLKLTLVQTALAWEHPQTNRAMLAEKMAQCRETDLIVLPEMFTTGFSMAAIEHARMPIVFAWNPSDAVWI